MIGRAPAWQHEMPKERICAGCGYHAPAQILPFLHSELGLALCRSMWRIALSSGGLCFAAGLRIAPQPDPRQPRIKRSLEP